MRRMVIVLDDNGAIDVRFQAWAVPVRGCVTASVALLVGVEVALKDAGTTKKPSIVGRVQFLSL